MTSIPMRNLFHLPGLGKIVAHALDVGRVAFILLGPVGVVMLASILRYAIFEYFHGGDQAVHAVWKAIGTIR